MLLREGHLCKTSFVEGQQYGSVSVLFIYCSIAEGGSGMTEAFVVCENFRAGFESKADLSKATLDFSFSAPIEPSPLPNGKENELLSQLKYIAPFVACGDLRSASSSSVVSAAC